MAYNSQIMIIQALTTTLLKLALLLLVGGILIFSLQSPIPVKTSPQTSYHSQTDAITLHCNSNRVCDLVVAK